jgi:4-diphosphocytidyl-2-C-methyl-D-erythritol kinase
MAEPIGQDEAVYHCYAKVNLILKVAGKRPDGYHDIDSLMQTVDLADTVRLSWGGGVIRVTCSEPGLDGEANLAWKAANAFLDDVGVRAGVRIHIDKRIPLAAGLGGGSSDAACVLNAMAARFGVPPGSERLLKIALRTGSDVPYLLGGGLARVRGRGEIVEPLASLEGLDLVVGAPEAEVRSSWAYARLQLELTESGRDYSMFKLDSALADRGSLAGALHNDLEEAVMDGFPVVRQLKKKMMDGGALGAVMSGSGPTVLAVVEGRAQALKLAESLAAGGYRAFALRATDSSHLVCN